MANTDGRDWAERNSGDPSVGAGAGSGSGRATTALTNKDARPSVTSLSLLEQARGGDEGAWRELFRLYTPLICYWCRKRGIQGADVDDVLQDVFQAAAKALPEFRRSRASDTFRGWLCGITRHKVLAFYRRRGSQPQAEGGSAMDRRLEQVADSDAGIDAEDATDDADDPKLLHELFRTVVEMVRAEFEERTWLAFWRTVIDGQRPVDVAVELSISSAAVRMAKCRVVRRVREQLGDCVD